MLYDYTFRPDGTTTKVEALDLAYETGIVCSDEAVLHPDPYPTREPTRVLQYPEFAQWCGTNRTADWHLRLGAQAIVYGHLHIPGTTWQDSVRFEEVSFGYPEELELKPDRPRTLRQILPAEPSPHQQE